MKIILALFAGLLLAQQASAYCACVVNQFTFGFCQTCTVVAGVCRCTGDSAYACNNGAATCVVEGLSPYSIYHCTSLDYLSCVDVASPQPSSTKQSIPTPAALTPVILPSSTQSVAKPVTTSSVVVVPGSISTSISAKSALSIATTSSLVSSSATTSSVAKTGAAYSNTLGSEAGMVLKVVIGCFAVGVVIRGL